MNAEEKICSICQRAFAGFGNNAQPVNDGRCCDECNQRVVLGDMDEDMVWDVFEQLNQQLKPLGFEIVQMDEGSDCIWAVVKIGEEDHLG
jgi:hypothetical protein